MRGPSRAPGVVEPPRPGADNAPMRAVLVLALLLAGCSAGGRDRAPAAGDTRPAAESGAGPAASRRLVTLEVGGMTCQGCVARIEDHLALVPGVRRVDVSLDRQRAVVLADSAVADSALTGAVRRAGSEFLGIVVGR